MAVGNIIAFFSRYQFPSNLNYSTILTDMAENTSEEPLKEEPENEAASAENQTTNESNRAEAASEDTVAAMAAEVADMKDKYIRLYSEFDNYKRRTAKEKLEFSKTANEGVIKELITVLDDFERAEKSFGEGKADDPVRAGFDLIHQKLRKVLEKQGLQVMESAVGKPLDTELHEAITQFPAPNAELKGKIIDEVEKGYYLNEKVIRYAKVIVGM